MGVNGIPILFRIVLVLQDYQQGINTYTSSICRINSIHMKLMKFTLALTALTTLKI
jgi:hypothetical protein